MSSSGYLCPKCNTIPLISIYPKDSDIKIFTVCKCDKKLYSVDAFIKEFYKENVTKNEETTTNEEKEINIEEKITEFNKIKEEMNQYNLLLKNSVVEKYQAKIKEIEAAYEKNKEINSLIEKIIFQLISNYNTNKKNLENLNNLLNNYNLNKTHKNRQIDYNNKKYNLQLESLTKETLNFFKKEYILSPLKNSLKTEKFLTNHNDSVTSFLEIESPLFKGGVSSSKDGYIILYSIKETPTPLLKFKAHQGGVVWVTKISEEGNNIISCGEDSMIKIWPSFKNEDFEGVTKLEERKIEPLVEFKCPENMKKIFDLGDKKIVACSLKGIYIYEYDIDSKKINLVSNLVKDKIQDMILFNDNNNQSKKEKLLGGYSATNLFFVKINCEDNYKLQLINETENKGVFFPNNLIQINQEEVVYGDNNNLKVYNVNEAQVKISKATEGYITCLICLNDGTFIRGERDGIRRFKISNLEELPPLIQPWDGYDFNHTTEHLNYLYQLKNGKVVLCYKDSTIKVCSLLSG